MLEHGRTRASVRTPGFPNQCTGDGIDDIATASGDDTVAFNRVVMFFSTGGTGSFSGPIYVPTGGINSSDVAIGDFDCDGRVDAIDFRVWRDAARPQ